MDLAKTLATLSAAAGVAGGEEGLDGILRPLLLDCCDRVEQDPNGSLTGWLDAPADRPLILLDAHLDEIGLIVTAVTEKGFLKFAGCGGVDVRTLPAAFVTVHTASGPIPGMVSTLPPHLKERDGDHFPKLTELAIDIGMEREAAEARVAPGDFVSFDIPPMTLQHDRIAGKSLDNRASVACLLYVATRMRQLAPDRRPCRLALLFSAQEEIRLRGAATAAYRIHPDRALVVDVSFAAAPGVPEEKCGKLGAGPMIGYAPILSRPMFERLRALAREREIPYQLEIMGGTTGTNADAITLAREGVPTALLSIPERNMHTPVEVVQLTDITATAELILAWLEGGASL